MNVDKRKEYVTRDTILRLLSDEEIARVSTAETATTLADGEEFIDLGAPEHGVRRAGSAMVSPMGQVLPRKALLPHTWDQVVGLLAAHRSEATTRMHHH